VNPVLSTIHHFLDEYKAKVKNATVNGSTREASRKVAAVAAA
jgi:hypothetical protein